MSIRPYQADALKSVAEAYRSGKRAPLVVMPTGTGKTVLFAELAKRTRHRCLFVTHTQDLVFQTADRVGSWCGETVGIEMAQRRDLTRPTIPGGGIDLFGENPPPPAPRLGVASVQTLASGDRLEEFRPDEFGYLIFDEAHHATAGTWRRVAEYFTSARRLGVTATPDRADGKALGGVFDSLAFEYRIDAAIRDGWLVPVRVFVVKTRIDLDAVKTKRNGDFDGESLDAKMTEEAALREVGDPVIKERGDRPTVVFCSGVSHAENLARYLCWKTNDPTYAAALSGKDDRETRKRDADRLARGEIKVLTNCQLFTEGWDCPPVSLVVMARPTKSRPLYSQMMGRGTRPSPATGKADLVCLDFVFNSDRHRLVTAFDIFKGDMSEEVAAKARDAAATRFEEDPDAAPIDVGDGLEAGFAEFTRERVEVLYELGRRDPFAAVGIDLAAYEEAAVVEPVTPKQRELLAKRGLKDEQIDRLSKRKASQVIDRLMARQNEGLCSPKQARILARQGVNPADVTFAEASSLLDYIQKGGWRPLENFDLAAWREDRVRAGIAEPSRSSP